MDLKSPCRPAQSGMVMMQLTEIQTDFLWMYQNGIDQSAVVGYLGGAKSERMA